jgi:DNA-binding response OmpR family regulator
MESKTILIVEDDKDLMLAMSVRLIAKGFATLSAQDAASAIQLAATRKPDLILMDLGLPDSNGFVVMEPFDNDALMSAIHRALGYEEHRLLDEASR